MILCVPSLLTTHRVSGATIYTGRILFMRNCQKGCVISCTSKPVSKLLTASCNPLSANKMLSITAHINARCSSEIDARPSRSFSSSDRAPDGAGLVLRPFSKAGRGEPWGAIWLPSGPAGFGETLRDDTSGSPASLGGTVGGGVPLSIISGRRSPEDELC